MSWIQAAETYCLLIASAARVIRLWAGSTTPWAQPVSMKEFAAALGKALGGRFLPRARPGACSSCSADGAQVVLEGQVAWRG